MVPDRYIRKQTLTNCERYITEELKNMESTILGAKDKLDELEYSLFSEIRAKIGLKPVDSQRANELINKNINKVGDEAALNSANNALQVPASDQSDIPTTDDSG